jgi:hypothetical protein
MHRFEGLCKNPHGVLGGFTVAWCDVLTPCNDSQTPSVKLQVPLTLHAYCTLVCYLILL